MKKVFLTLAAMATLFAPAMAEQIHNRSKVDGLKPGVSIDMTKTGLIKSTVTSMSGGMVYLDADLDKSHFVVPAMHPIWINGREALQTELVPGARVEVALLQHKEMRAKEFAGERAQIGTYEGLITISPALVDQFHPDYYIYTAEPTK